MKILIGVLIALVLALAGCAWALQESQRKRGLAEQLVVETREALAKSEGQNKALVGRFDSLDASLKGLGVNLKANQAQLQATLKGIQNIVQEPGDSDESIRCLDVRVPAQLDRGLR